MGDLANCPRCNGIFVKGFGTAVCPACRKKEEQDFQTVYAFIRQKQNRAASVEEIVAKTGVEGKRIREFVKQQRLHPAQFPALTYDCEKCGAQIREGRLCTDCKDEIEQGVKQHDLNEEIAEKRKQEEKMRGMTYYSNGYKGR